MGKYLKVKYFQTEYDFINDIYYFDETQFEKYQNMPTGFDERAYAFKGSTIDLLNFIISLTSDLNLINANHLKIASTLKCLFDVYVSLVDSSYNYITIDYS